MSEIDKFMPAEVDFEAYLRARAEGHIPGVEIAIYARPAQWIALADQLARTHPPHPERRERIETEIAAYFCRLELQVKPSRAPFEDSNLERRGMFFARAADLLRECPTILSEIAGEGGQPLGYLLAKAGENNGYYFVSHDEFQHVEERFHNLYAPIYAAPVPTHDGRADRYKAGVEAAYAALFKPDESDAIDNLTGALIDIKRFSEQGKPTDEVCIRTLERIEQQLCKAHAELEATGLDFPPMCVPTQSPPEPTK